jgi:hypothetical protein
MGLDPPKFGTHPLAPSQSDVDLPPNRQSACGAIIVGLPKIESTVRYLGIEIDDGIEITEKIEV